MGSPGGSAHPPSPEEIEKKLNIYHKGAKIWKMLIFCQVGPRASLPRRGVGGRAEGAAWVCVLGEPPMDVWCVQPPG